MSEYSKRDPADVPPYVNSHLYKKVLGDGKTMPPPRSLAEVTWAVFGPELLEAVKMAYRKHHLEDDSIGWEELSEVLHNALCNTMGDSGYQEWIKRDGR